MDNKFIYVILYVIFIYLLGYLKMWVYGTEEYFSVWVISSEKLS